MHVHRRQLLSSASAAAALAASPALVLAADAPLAPPKASLRPVTETLHGVAITDRYRWMEDAKDPEWMPYLMGQNAYARQVLGKIPGREALAAKIGAVSGALVAVSGVQAAGPYVFSQVRPIGANTFKLFVREGIAGKDRLLLDPDVKATAGAHYSLDYWLASPDGSHVVVGTSPAGSEDSSIQIIETASGAFLPETIDRAQFGAPSWLPDGSGFFFVRFREGVKHGDPDHYLDSKI